MQTSDTYQHIQGWILLLEGFCKLPDSACLRHVNNMDVYLLQYPAECHIQEDLWHHEPHGEQNTHRIPRLIDNNLPGLLCFIFVPAHHMDRPAFKQTHETF